MTVRRVVPILTVSDLDAAREAYVRTFGLRAVMNHGWIVTLADDELRHQVSLMTKDATAPVNPECVHRGRRRRRRLPGRGRRRAADRASIERRGWGVRRFFFADAAGNVVNVLSHQPASMRPTAFATVSNTTESSIASDRVWFAGRMM